MLETMGDNDYEHALCEWVKACRGRARWLTHRKSRIELSAHLRSCTSLLLKKTLWHAPDRGKKMVGTQESKVRCRRKRKKLASEERRDSEHAYESAIRLTVHPGGDSPPPVIDVNADSKADAAVVESEMSVLGQVCTCESAASESEWCIFSWHGRFIWRNRQTGEEKPTRPEGVGDLPLGWQVDSCDDGEFFLNVHSGEACWEVSV